VVDLDYGAPVLCPYNCCRQQCHHDDGHNHKQTQRKECHGS
jgi:hypothetical protein